MRIVDETIGTFNSNLFLMAFHEMGQFVTSNACMYEQKTSRSELLHFLRFLKIIADAATSWSVGWRRRHAESSISKVIEKWRDKTSSDGKSMVAIKTIILSSWKTSSVFGWSWLDEFELLTTARYCNKYQLIQEYFMIDSENTCFKLMIHGCRIIGKNPRRNQIELQSIAMAQ